MVQFCLVQIIFGTTKVMAIWNINIQYHYCKEVSSTKHFEHIRPLNEEWTKILPKEWHQRTMEKPDKDNHREAQAKYTKCYQVTLADNCTSSKIHR